MSVQLKPCPFCGGKAEIEQYGTPRMCTICTCTQCGCTLSSPETFNHGSTWNMREYDPSDPWFQEAVRKYVMKKFAIEE